MKHSFSFCGMPIEKLGLEYLPQISQIPVLLEGSNSVSEQVFQAHDGGYFYGINVQPKIFNLRCLFVDKDIRYGTLHRVQQFFQRGKSGKLIFSDFDWLWYSATVQKVSIEKLVNTQNGLISISLKCYYPFARHDGIAATKAQMRQKQIVEISGLFTEDMTPETKFSDITGSIDFLLYNGGSEVASTAVKIAGTFEELQIYNETLDQTCVFKNVDTADGEYYICDALNGKTIKVQTQQIPAQDEQSEPVVVIKSKKLDFLKHTSGFIELAPATPVYRNVNVRKRAGTNNLVGVDCFYDAMVGQYAYVLQGEDGISSKWHKITQCTGTNEIFIQDPCAEDGSAKIHIAQMNHIMVKVTGGTLKTLQFEYKPTFK